MQNDGGALTIVIVLDHGFVSGGQSRVAFDSALGLQAIGHRPIVFAAAGPVDPQLIEAGVTVVCLDQADLISNPSKVAAAVQGIWNKPAAKALGELLATLPQDRTVVHVHGWAKALSPSIAEPIRQSGLPAIYTMHEYFILCPNGGFYNYRTAKPCSLDPLSLRCWGTNCDSRTYTRKVWRNVRQTVMEEVAKLPSVFSDYILISEFQRAAVGHHLPQDVRVHRVSNPIAAIDLGPKTAPAAGDFVFVGRLSPEKGTFVFAEAAQKRGIRPVFVGEGPIREELQARFPEALIIGWQNQEGVRKAMRAARALVFPSLWYEGQPLTVLEAKAMGTPVIVSDGCAGRDAVTDGVSGLWFKRGDADDLARALTVLTDDKTVSRFSRAAYDDFWSDAPTIDRHVATIVGIYRGMLGLGEKADGLRAIRTAA